MDTGLDPDAVSLIEALGLESHPEGGRYAETWRAAAQPGQRAAGTAIYFLLTEGEVSHWHRVDATEIWHFYAGSPLLLRTSSGTGVDEFVLGRRVAEGERPQLVVDTGVWQSATSTGRWTLAGCTVAPGFDFSGFELAPTGWEPSNQGLPGRP